jgi:hypothetical protein
MRLKICLWVILVSLLPITGYAQTQKDSPVQELYVKSGLKKQLEQLPFIIQAAFEQAGQEDDSVRKLPNNIISTIKASVQEAFAPAILKEALLPELREKLTAQDIKKVLNWLDSPLGKKCTQLEEAASTPEALAEMEKYADRMQNSPPTAQRLNILRKLDSAIKATKSNVEMAINTQVAVALAILTTFPLEQQGSPEDILREVGKNRPNLEAAVREQVLISLLYTYKSLTDNEIQQYIEFATSPIGSKYHSVATAALNKAFLGGSIRWGKKIGDAIKQEKTQI